MTAPAGAGDLFGSLTARTFPLWSRFAVWSHGYRKILQVPDFGDGAADSVREKYSQQVESYTAMRRYQMNETAHRLLTGSVRPGGSILIAGWGAGGEALQLAGEGYRVTGFDFLPAMIETSRASAEEADLKIEFLCADMTSLDLQGRRFDAAFVTPLVYSFIAGRANRIEALRRLGEVVSVGGKVIFSANLIDGVGRILQALLSWMHRRARGSTFEFGDWYTRFMTPRGQVGCSFTHLSFPGQVRREAKQAGYREVSRGGASHFVAARFGGR